MNNPFKKGTTKIDIETQKQLSFPKGIKGKEIGKKMFSGNADVINKCLEKIEFTPDLKICDIGCGPGYALKKLSAKFKKTELIGIDPSLAMVSQSKKNNQKDITSGKIKIKTGSTPNLPLPNNYFDYVLLINILYFWKNPIIDFKDIFRILNTKGKLILYFTDKSSMQIRISEKDGIYRFYKKSDVLALLKENGFNSKNIKTETFIRKSGELGNIFVISKNN